MAKRGRPPSEKLPPKLQARMEKLGINGVYSLAEIAELDGGALAYNINGSRRMSLSSAMAVLKALKLDTTKSEALEILDELNSIPTKST